MSSAYGRNNPLDGADRAVATAPSASRISTSAAANSNSNGQRASLTTVPAAQSAASSRNDGQYPRPRAGDDGAAADVGNDREDCESLTPSVESWVEIDSQPSSSSVSSIASDIVVTGLRVGHGASGRNGGTMSAAPQRRRRLLQQVEAEAVAVAATRPSASASVSADAPPPQRRASAIVAPVARSLAESQEEYDESESEEDRLMASSAEHVHVRHPPTPPQPFALLQQQAQARMQQRAAASDGDDEDDEDDDDGTALGAPSSGLPTFRPQPNAFSHPPHHLQQQQQQQQQQHRSVPSPAHQHMAASCARPSSMTAQRSASRGSRDSVGPPHFVTPPHSSNREDNDAVLRASLTTLLSCAAAARGLPKKEAAAFGESAGIASGLRPSTQPMDLRLVPESELMEEAPAGARSHAAFQSPRISSRMPPRTTAAQAHRSGSASRLSPRSGSTRAVPSSRDSAVSAVSSSSRSKRTSAAAAAAGSPSKSQRAMKKKRTSTAAYGEATTTFLTPTVLTWVVSAGVVVLVSVVGFGAGFVLGREVGKQEAVSAGGALGGSAASNATSSCGSEIMRSSTGSTLRRFRWGSGMTRSVAA